MPRKRAGTEKSFKPFFPNCRKTIAQKKAAKTRYSVESAIESHVATPFCLATSVMALFNPRCLEITTYTVGSSKATTNASVLAEKGLMILLGWRLSQPRINSNPINHMKNSWKVLPFHIASNDPGLSRYNHRSGTANAANGNSFKSVFSCSLRKDRTLCILNSTKPELTDITGGHPILKKHLFFLKFINSLSLMHIR
jgi:hypothetical protein